MLIEDRQVEKAELILRGRCPLCYKTFNQCILDDCLNVDSRQLELDLFGYNREQRDIKYGKS